MLDRAKRTWDTREQRRSLVSHFRVSHLDSGGDRGRWAFPASIDKFRHVHRRGHPPLAARGVRRPQVLMYFLRAAPHRLQLQGRHRLRRADLRHFYARLPASPDSLLHQ